MPQNFLLWMILYLVLKMAIHFYIFYIRSIQNKYQDISQLLQQLDSFVILTETWMSEEQSLNINLSAEHNFMHKNWSHQTVAAMIGVQEYGLLRK